MFGSFVDKFDMNETEDGTEEKTFSFTPYAEYIEQKEKDEGKKEKKTRPKELKEKTNFLKIVKYSTNKHKIKPAEGSVKSGKRIARGQGSGRGGT